MLRRSHAFLIITLLGLAMFVPYAVAGPGLMRDDWFTLRNATLDSWWMSAGSDQWRARPVGAAIYAVIFGLIGRHPLIHFMLAGLVMALIAVLLYVVTARFVPRVGALAFAVTWLILPNHTSLEMWASAFNIAVALLCLVAGVERLTHPEVSKGRDWTAAVLFGVGTLSYEAIGPVSVAAVALVAFRRQPGRRLQALLPSAATLGAAGAWMLLNWHPEKTGLNQTVNLELVLPGHFGYTLLGDFLLARQLVPIVVLVVSALAIFRLVARDRRDVGWEVWAVVVGWAVIVLGTLPFIRYFYAPIGFGDRVTVVSGVGGALVLTGVAVMLGRAWKPLAGVAAALFLVGAVPQRISLVSDYATAADDARRVLAAVQDRWPTPPEKKIVFGPAVVERNIRAFEPMQFPLEALYGTSEVEVRNAFDVEEFEAAPEESRFDLRVYSKLDDGRLGPPDERPPEAHP